MLKLIQNSINVFESVSSDTKCAEIHYFTSNFNIVCVMCQELYQEYHHFLKHFQDRHFYEFRRSLYNTHDKELTQKCVKQELHKELLTQTPVVEEAEEIFEDYSTYNELLYCKVEDGQERVMGNLSSNEHQLNVPDINSVVNDVEEEEKDNEVDWSHTFPPTHLKLNEKRSYKPRNQPNSCTYCGKTFRRRYQLDTHLNIHTGRKPHQCDVCGRQFRAITTLQRHLNTHEKRQTFTCQFCCKEFSHRAALVSHETRHTQERCIPCEDCSKMFYTQNQLDTHKRKLHNKSDDFSLPFACDMCAKRYRSASMLSTHKFKKHYKTARFSCEQCGKKFVEQCQLNNHMSIHFKKS
ncbi:gastrula zinc finger protein xFG20-1-like [Calliphora vicina]|uniref:gastrula zinc finger protein xFG20-1-like n=1 Tax=Calliphora vicina TaxID=7373 RepID=UPI00325B2BAF